MARSQRLPSRIWRAGAFISFLGSIWLASVPAQAQSFVGFVELSPFVVGLQPVASNGAVGGVSVDATGALALAEADLSGELRQQWLAAYDPVSKELAAKSPLRKISLRRLQQAMLAQLESGKPLTGEMHYLAGLQRVRYVLAYPEQNDIVLAGPAEEWVADDRGNIVGIATRRPALMLDDLIVALRYAEAFSQGGIACSIDPTAEGLAKIQEATRALPSQPSKKLLADLAETLGEQTISIRGVPDSSHFARVLVAADYRMKRLAMGLDPSPLKGLPSYLQLYKGGDAAGVQNLLPRWWLASHYEPLLVDPSGLAWELRGPGVKAESEVDFLAADGSRQRTGKTSDAAAKWAAAMTSKYDALCAVEPIFGELRNVMDLAVVAALITSEQLAKKTHCDLGMTRQDDGLAVASFEPPTHVPTRMSLTQVKKRYVLFASGGVGLDAWGALKDQEQSAELTEVRTAATARDESSWWWD